MTPSDFSAELAAMRRTGFDMMAYFRSVTAATPEVLTAICTAYNPHTYGSADVFRVLGDDLADVAVEAWRCIAILDSRRIPGDANPGEGEFIKHIGRA